MSTPATLADALSRVAVPVRLAVTACFAAVMVVLSTIPGESQPDDSTFVWLFIQTPRLLQKSMHVCMYAVLTLLLIWCVSSAWKWGARALAGAGAAVAFGAALEVVQTRIPGRYGTLFDVMLDLAGALAAVLVAALALRMIAPAGRRASVENP